jgi:hypothetical protein
MHDHVVRAFLPKSSLRNGFMPTERGLVTFSKHVVNKKIFFQEKNPRLALIRWKSVFSRNVVFFCENKSLL